MKNFTYTLFYALIFLFISSCSEDVLDFAPTSSLTQDASAKNEGGSTEIITSETPLPFMTKHDLKKRRPIEGDFNIAAWTEFGPYTVSTTMTNIQSNYKMYIPSQAGYAAGLYFCWIYKVEKVVTLQPGDLMMFENASKIGYANWSTLEPGVLITQNGNTYTITTYSIVPEYNSIGQYIYNGTLPQDLTGTTFTYKFLRNI